MLTPIFKFFRTIFSQVFHISPELLLSCILYLKILISNIQSSIVISMIVVCLRFLIAVLNIQMLEYVRIVWLGHGRILLFGRSQPTSTLQSVIRVSGIMQSIFHLLLSYFFALPGSNFVTVSLPAHLPQKLFVLRCHECTF